MGETTAIAWTDHTFNPWWGCERVSPGCTHCYAEAFAKRTGNAVWGKQAPRRFFGDAHWAEPLKWDRLAQSGVPGPNTGRDRHLVFCASMADVFENRRELIEPRSRLFDLIGRTPNLDWLLLTKRPQNIEAMLPAGWIVGDWPDSEWAGPPNLWLGTTVEDQQRAEERVPWLISIPAPVRFLSCEPLLGPVDLTRIRAYTSPHPDGFNVDLNALTGHAIGPDDVYPFSIDWVICGGESGPNHRPLDLDHARRIRDHCSGKVCDPWGVNERLPVPFFFKQVGGRTPTAGGDLLDGEQIKQFPAVAS